MNFMLRMLLRKREVQWEAPTSNNSIVLERISFCDFGGVKTHTQSEKYFGSAVLGIFYGVLWM